MSQTFTDDCYSGGMQAAISLQAFEDNFASLKSTFSGTSAPSNIVAGMLWYDTTAHVLKVRNEGNTDWVTIASVVTGYKSHAITEAKAHTAGNKKMFYTTSGGVITELALGTAAQVLRVNSGATAPEFATLNTTKCKMGQFVRASNAASGAVAYTGVGFTPVLIIFISYGLVYDGGPTLDIVRTGYDDKTSHHWFASDTSSVTESMKFNFIHSYTQTGYATTFGSDGFTITWTRTSGGYGDSTVTNYLGTYISIGS